ncbi:50S ribosomal protein L6 [bacterium]|nr:50S ribosomal protein L6 [bacterium]
MSRIGKQPIPIPDKVTVDLQDHHLKVIGPKGDLERHLHPEITINIDENEIVVTRPSDAKRHRALHGLTRALVANMVAGVSDGFRKSMEISGVGYKVELRGQALVFTLGFSHLIMLQAPPTVAFEVESPTLFHISGIDKELVGQVAAAARSLRPPDPYKAKGVKYVGEQVRRKAGKTAK